MKPLAFGKIEYCNLLAINGLTTESSVPDNCQVFAARSKDMRLFRSLHSLDHATFSTFVPEITTKRFSTIVASHLSEYSTSISSWGYDLAYISSVIRQPNL